MLAASAAFRAAGNPTVAADVVGSMLTRWHYVALLAPLALFSLELRRVRRAVLLVLFAAVLLAAAQSFVDLRIRAIRSNSSVPISDLDRQDPVRRRFGALHGLSMMLLALQAIGAGVVVMARPAREELESVPVAPVERTTTPPPPIDSESPQSESALHLDEDAAENDARVESGSNENVDAERRHE